MKNIHIYPSPLTHESRIAREVAAITRMDIFREIHIVGTASAGASATERIGETVILRRLGPKKATGVAKIARYPFWLANVLFYCLRERPACINCHSLPVLPVGVIAKLLCRSKLIYDAHELETETIGMSGLSKWIRKGTERAFFPFVDYTIVVGEKINEWYSRTYQTDAVSTVYNTPDESIAERWDYYREKFGIPAQTPIFLYLGALSPGRGIEPLLDAFSVIPSAVIIFQGWGPLQKRIESAVGGNVYFHPPVPQDQVVRYAAAADFGVSVLYPGPVNHEYALPNKFFQSIMAGNPLLVSPTKEQADTVVRLNLGEVCKSLDPSDIRAAAEILISAGRNRYLDGIAKAQLLFRWETQESRLRNVYLDRLGYKKQPL